MKIRKKTLGLILLLFPWILVPLVLSAYAISTFLIMISVGGESNLAGIGSFIRIFLGFLGIVAVLGFFVGTPLGIFFLSRKEPDRFIMLKSKPRFQSLTDVELHVVTRWSWGAFFSPTIWALGNKLWLWAIGTFIPFWNVYAWLRLAIDGRQIVWERSQLTISQFSRRQKIIAWIIGVVIVIAILFGSPVLRFFTTRPVSDSVGTPATSSSEVLTSEPETTVLGAQDLFNETPPSTNDSSDSFSSQGANYACGSFQDTDGDGLSDEVETALSTNVEETDTDGDGYSDLEELIAGYSPNNAKSYQDTDKDELPDAWEMNFYQSRVTVADSDGDGLTDFEEVKLGTNPNGIGQLTGRSSVVGNYLLLVEMAQQQCTFD